MRERSRLQPLLQLALILGIALWYRLDFLIASNFVVDADEAIVGLMAKRIQEGAPLPVFYYGQHYMGSFEAILASLLFSKFGVSSEALKAIPLLFSLALIPVVYGLAFRLAGQLAGITAALLTAIPPVSLLEWSTKARGGFVELMFVAAWSLLFAFRFLSDKRGHLFNYFSAIFLLGFGWWVNNQIIFFIPAIFLLFTVRVLELNESKLRYFLAGPLAFLLGSFPFWLYNVELNFPSASLFSFASPTEIWLHTKGVFSEALPIILGAKRFWQVADVFPYATLIVFCLYFIIFAVSAISILPIYFDASVDLTSIRRNLAMLVMVFCSALIIFVISSFGHLFLAPRYLLPVYIPVFVLSGFVAAKLSRRNRTLSVLMVIGLLSVNFASYFVGGRSIPGEPFVANAQRVSKDHSDLIRWLAEHQISEIRTNYWIGYRLAFETLENLKFTIFSPPFQVRMPEYEIPYPRKLFLPLVLVPFQADLVKRALDVLGWQFKQAQVSNYEVIYDLLHKEPNLNSVPPTNYALQADFKSDQIANAADGNLATRWGTGTPQAPGMKVKAVFHSPVALKSLKIEYAKWIHDRARSLELDVVTENGQLIQVVTPEEYIAVRYYLMDLTYDQFELPNERIKEVIITQSGHDPVFDWSIAELEFFE